MLWVFLRFVPHLLHLVPKAAQDNNHAIVTLTGSDT